MSIEVNGKTIEWIDNETIQDLLKRMKYSFPLVIVKINNNIIQKSDYSKTIIPNNSKIFVIHMISGG